MRHRWVVMAASFYAFAAFAYGMQIVPPLMRPLIEEFDISHAQAGLLFSAVVIPGIFLAIPAGILTDRYGVRLTGTASTVLVALGCIVSAAAGSFAALLAGRLVLGAGGAFISTTLPTLIAQWFPRGTLGRAMGIYGLNIPVASMAAFLSASSLAAGYGWRYPFYASAALAALSVAPFALAVREGPLKSERRGGTEVGRALRSAEIWKLGAVWLLFNASAISFTTWTPKIFEEFGGMSPVQASTVASLPMMASIPCTPLYGWISDRNGRRKPLMVLGSASMTLAILATAYGPEASTPLSTAAFGVTSSMVPPMVMALPPEILGPSLSGTGFGVVMIGLNLGAALAPPTAGLLMDMTGSPSLSLAGMALFSGLGAAVALMLRSR